eukprot:scaffold115997_cov19-Tisochrysis_lutea.AAC.1
MSAQKRHWTCDLSKSCCSQANACFAFFLVNCFLRIISAALDVFEAGAQVQELSQVGTRGQ